MESINKTVKFLAPLSIKEDAVHKLYDEMYSSKQRVNEVLGLNKGNNFKRTIDFNITEEIFKNTYPETYKYLEYLTDGNEFNLVKNWIKAPNKRKLSRYLINKIESIKGISSSIESKIYNEIRNGDISVIFDIIKPKTLVISTNMYDFMTSASNAAFRSCYAIDGSHFNGNIAYMTDPYTFMIYTYSDKPDRKIGRMWGYYLDHKEPMFLTSRIYGSMYKSEIEIATLTISSLINNEINWKSLNIEYENYSNARPKIEYPIPVYFDYDAITLHHTMESIDYNKLPHLTFNSINCMKCGEKTENGYYGMCHSCMDDVIRCSRCNGIFHYNKIVVNTDVCQECYETYYIPCSICSTKYDENNMHDLNGNKVCHNCIIKTHKKCVLCGEFHENENIKDINGAYLCSKCIGRVYTCSMCNQIVLLEKDESPLTYKDKEYCKNCLKEILDGNIISCYERDDNEVPTIDFEHVCDPFSTSRTELDWSISSIDVHPQISPTTLVYHDGSAHLTYRAVTDV